MILLLPVQVVRVRRLKLRRHRLLSGVIDRDKLARLHAALQSADWVGFVGASADLAIADYKGRLLYASADRAAWGADATASDQVAAIYRAGGKVALGVVRGDDADIVRSGIVGKGHVGLFVLFGRATVIDGQPRALYLQLVEGATLLDEVRLGEQTLLSLVAHGTVVGNVPVEVVAGSGGAAIAEVEHDGATWLVQRYPLDSPDASAPIAEIVVAREMDVGVGALFPHARATLGAAAAILAIVVLAGFAIARRRDLTRRVLRVASAT